jgi:beta-aspartyl-peptidase (threonine type)
MPVMNGHGSAGNYVIAAHGGAGVWRNELTAEREKESREVMRAALQEGGAILKRGGTCLDAVEAAVRALEDSPLFNAGRGAVLTSDGGVELDAAIMDGATRRAGAVAAVKRLRNPISAARLIMEKSPHVLMVAEGAEDFAKLCGFELVSPKHFVTAERQEQLRRVREEERSRANSARDVIGTVGAVALDIHGNLAAGTSTGGMVNKRFGRIGDSPLIGAGTYACNESCAVSATGHGEFFIRAVAAHQLAMLMRHKGLALDQAAAAVIADAASMGGRGGVIAVDRAGAVAMPFNTEGMFRGVTRSDGLIEIAVFPG